MVLLQKLGLVMLGGACGSGLRWLVSEWALARFGPGFPWGTFLVNISGALLMGGVLGYLLARPGGVWQAGSELPWRLLLASGLLGGYTTFSALAWESLALAESGAIWRAAVNLFGTLAAGMLAVWAGALLGRAL